MLENEDILTWGACPFCPLDSLMLIFVPLFTMYALKEGCYIDAVIGTMCNQKTVLETPVSNNEMGYSSFHEVISVRKLHNCQS